MELFLYIGILKLYWMKNILSILKCWWFSRKRCVCYFAYWILAEGRSKWISFSSSAGPDVFPTHLHLKFNSYLGICLTVIISLFFLSLYSFYFFSYFFLFYPFIFSFSLFSLLLLLKSRGLRHSPAIKITTFQLQRRASSILASRASYIASSRYDFKYIKEKSFIWKYLAPKNPKYQLPKDDKNHTIREKLV